MARTVEEEIASPLTDEVLFGKLSAGGEVRVDVSRADGSTEILTFDYGKR